MTDEDRTASRLKGENCLIKFKDGEELRIHLDYGDDENEFQWFSNMESFINDEEGSFCPLPGFAMTAGSIKYVRKI